MMELQMMLMKVLMIACCFSKFHCADIFFLSREIVKHLSQNVSLLVFILFRYLLHSFLFSSIVEALPHTQPLVVHSLIAKRCT